MRESNSNQAADAPSREGGLRLRRHFAMLGGTVSFADCLSVLRYLITPANLVHGPAIFEYERAFARTIGVSHACSFSSARVGFYGLLRSMGVGVGDEVLLQVPTHIVVANAIRYAGARPVYVDCDPENYNMDLADAAGKITARTKVLLIQHTFGIPAQMDLALALARRHDLVLIEDCVHALGAKFDGKMVGSIGRAGFFSTEETKTISTTMGGMVVTQDPELAAKMKLFQDTCTAPTSWLAAGYLLKLLMYCVLAHPYLHYYTRAVYEACGQRLPLPRPTTKEEVRGVKPPRYEQLLSNAQAVMGLRQLQDLEENISHRRMIADLYMRELTRIGFQLPRAPEGSEPAYVRFPVQVADRPDFLRVAAPHLLVGTWFDTVLQEAVTPECGDYVRGSCPRAESAAEHLINFPTHPHITPDDALRIISILAGH